MVGDSAIEGLKADDRNLEFNGNISCHGQVSGS